MGHLSCFPPVTEVGPDTVNKASWTTQASLEYIPHFIGFTKNPPVPLLQFPGSHFRRFKDYLAGMVFRPVTISNSVILNHVIVQFSAGEWRQYMELGSVNLVFHYEIIGLFKNIRAISIKSEDKTANYINPDTMNSFNSLSVAIGRVP